MPSQGLQHLHTYPGTFPILVNMSEDGATCFPQALLCDGSTSNSSLGQVPQCSKLPSFLDSCLPLQLPSSDNPCYCTYKKSTGKKI